MTPVPTVSETETPCREIGNLPPSGGREVNCLLGLLAFVGWRLATYDWTPMETVRRTIEHGYGVAVVRLLNADDMNQPVRVITEGGQYVAWYTDGRESRIHTAILIVNKGRIALTTPDMGILPTLRETI